MKLGNPQIMEKDRRRAAVLEDLLRAITAHDPYTGGHSYRTAAYASAVAVSLGYPPPVVELVRQAALVHDAGKIGIPEAILQKTEELTAEEQTILRLHPLLGVNLLSRLPETVPLLPIVLHHHERWDGDGYPHGLSGVEIPIGSRILLAADAYDAMTTQRPYGPVLEPGDALAEIARSAGTQLDPLVVDAIHEAFKDGALDGRRTIRIMDTESPRI